MRRAALVTLVALVLAGCGGALALIARSCPPALAVGILT